MYILVYFILVVTTYIPTLKYFYFANVSESDVIYALLGNETKNTEQKVREIKIETVKTDSHSCTYKS